MGFLSLFNFNNNFGLSEIFTLLIVFIIIYITHYYYKYFTRINPLPGPLPIPLIGNLYLFKLDDYSRFATKCHEKYGEIFELYFAGERQIYIGKLNVIDKLFNPSSKTNFKLRVLKKSGLDEFGTSGYGVVFNHDYKSWNFNRQFFTQAMLTPSFTQLCLNQSKDFINLMMKNYWNFISINNLEFDLRKWMFCFMNDMLLDVFVGRKGYALNDHYSRLINQSSTEKKSQSDDNIHKDSLYVDYLMKYIEGFTFYLFFGTFAKYVPGLRGIAKKHHENKERYWNLIYDIINEQKNIIKNTPKDQLRNDMINLLLTANTDNDINISKNRIKDLYPEYQRPMNDKELMVNLTEALGGGIDSISSTFTFMIYNLIKNPEVINKIREEIVEILGKDPRPIEVDDLDKFKYVEAVIKETARINSLTPFVDRFNEVPEEVAGYNWPSNTHFIINSSGTQSDSKYWNNPKKFDPERFINPSNLNNPKALVLFGGGVRICPGRKLAMTILKVLITLVIHQFDFELVNPDKPIKSKFAVFNLPDELFIRLKKRSF